MPNTRQCKILINAIHTSTGGGLIYLQGILPHLVKILTAKNCKIVLLCREGAITKLKVPKAVEVRLTPNYNFLQVHGWEQFILPFKLKKWQIDATLCNSNYIPLAAKNAVPIIHNNPNVVKFAQGIVQKTYWPVLVFLTRLSMWRAKGVVSVAKHIIPTYAAGFWGFLAPKIVVATPACGVPENKSKLKQQNFIFAVGDIYVQKNYLTLLKALGILRQKHNVKLLIAGRIVDKAVYAQMLTIIDILNLKNAVTVAMPMPHHKILETMQTAKMVVSPSFVECFNMPVLESVMCNTPVVVADLPFQREVVSDFANYYTPVNDEKSLAIAIENVLNNPKKSAQLSKNALEYGKQFSWQKSAATIAKILIN